MLWLDLIRVLYGAGSTATACSTRRSQDPLLYPTESVMARIAYGAYGDVSILDPVGTSTGQPRFGTYAWRRFGEETELYAYGTRYFSAFSRGIIGRDPLDASLAIPIHWLSSVQMYEYVGSCPVEYTDPTGLKRYRCGYAAMEKPYWVSYRQLGCKMEWVFTGRGGLQYKLVCIYTMSAAGKGAPCKCEWQSRQKCKRCCHDTHTGEVTFSNVNYDGPLAGITWGRVVNTPWGLGCNCRRPMRPPPKACPEEGQWE